MNKIEIVFDRFKLSLLVCNRVISWVSCLLSSSTIDVTKGMLFIIILLPMGLDTPQSVPFATYNL